MPTYRESRLTCEKCGHTFDIAIWAAIDAYQSEQRAELLSGSIFLHACPACAHRNRLEYTLVYTDTERKKKILLDAQEGRAELFELGMVEESRSGYDLRLVSTVEACAEKIRVFEAGLNDKALELWKVVCLARTQRAYAGRGITELRYLPQESAKYIYLEALRSKSAEKRTIATLAFPRAEYEQFLQTLLPHIHKKDKHGRYVRIDSTWANAQEGRALSIKAGGLSQSEPRENARFQSKERGAGYCPQCGYALREKSRFCSQCGHALFAKATHSAEETLEQEVEETRLLLNKLEIYVREGKLTQAELRHLKSTLGMD